MDFSNINWETVLITVLSSSVFWTILGVIFSNIFKKVKTNIANNDKTIKKTAELGKLVKEQEELLTNIFVLLNENKTSNDEIKAQQETLIEMLHAKKKQIGKAKSVIASLREEKLPSGEIVGETEETPQASD